MWFSLTGDERITKRCATENCGGQPTWRLEAGGSGSDYCAGCKAKIAASELSKVLRALTPETPSAGVTIRKVALDIPEGLLNVVGSALRSKADEFHGWGVRNPRLAQASGWTHQAKWLDEQADRLFTEAGGGIVTMRRTTDD